MPGIQNIDFSYIFSPDEPQSEGIFHLAPKGNILEADYLLGKMAVSWQASLPRLPEGNSRFLAERAYFFVSGIQNIDFSYVFSPDEPESEGIFQLPQKGNILEGDYLLGKMAVSWQASLPRLPEGNSLFLAKRAYSFISGIQNIDFSYIFSPDEPESEGIFQLAQKGNILEADYLLGKMAVSWQASLPRLPEGNSLFLAKRAYSFISGIQNINFSYIFSPDEPESEGIFQLAPKGNILEANYLLGKMAVSWQASLPCLPDGNSLFLAKRAYFLENRIQNIDFSYIFSPDEPESEGIFQLAPKGNILEADYLLGKMAVSWQASLPRNGHFPQKVI